MLGLVLSRLRVTFVSCMPTRELRYARRTREAFCLCSARISRGYKQYLVLILETLVAIVFPVVHSGTVQGPFFMCFIGENVRGLLYIS